MNLEQAQFIAEQLMEQHGLLAKGWKFEWDNAVSRAGCCHWHFWPFLRGNRITLSRTITEANPRTHLVNIMLHEIAHALAGARHHHDKYWKQIARSIGCTADRCCTRETRVPERKWVVVCPQCGNTRRYHRRRNEIRSCGKCSPHLFDRRFVMLWQPASKVQQPKAARADSGRRKEPAEQLSLWGNEQQNRGMS